MDSDEAHNKHAELQAQLSDHMGTVARPSSGMVESTSRSVPQHPPPGVHIICTAVLYDDLLRQVRVWARLGHSPAEIQRELDARFARVAAVLETLAAGRSRGVDFQGAGR